MPKYAMLSTVDNPFNPFKQFDEWFAFDCSKGYFTCNFLARIANLSNELPDNVNDFILQQAIDDICEQNVSGLYCKVYKDDDVAQLRQEQQEKEKQEEKE